MIPCYHQRLHFFSLLEFDQRGYVVSMLLHRQGNRRSAPQRGVRAGTYLYCSLRCFCSPFTFFKFEYNSRHQRQQSQQQQKQQQQHRQQQTRIHRPQPAPPPPPHAQQPISQRVEGIVSPETSPELSPTDFQVDLEAGIRHPHPRLPLPPPPARAQSLRRQESSEINPFLPDLDPEPEPEPELLLQDEAVAAAAQRGYDVGPHSEDEEEGLGSSALFPGSDIF